jgi:hypothetical protein
MSLRVSWAGSVWFISSPQATVRTGNGRDWLDEWLAAVRATREDPDFGGSKALEQRFVSGLDEDGVLVPGPFAVGDVTAESSYTHSASANYQARIIAAQAAGEGRDADYSAIPALCTPTRRCPASGCTGPGAVARRRGS